MTDTMGEAYHVHRTCWVCGTKAYGAWATGRAARVHELHTLERQLRRRGWRFLEDWGRMLCPSCAQLRLPWDLPEEAF